MWGFRTPLERREEARRRRREELLNLAHVAFERGDSDRAEALWAEAASLDAELGEEPDALVSS